MSVTEVLNSISIMTDYSREQWQFIVCGVLLCIAALIGIIYLVDIVATGYFKVEKNISVYVAIYTLITVIGTILLFWWYAETPISIKMYIASNDVTISQISTYFDVNSISSVDENTFMNIEPKEEYYEEALEWYKVFTGHKA